MVNACYVQAIMDEHPQSNHLRDELRLLIIPLLNRCLNESPEDLVLFCTRYFESLLQDRDNAGLSETKGPISSVCRSKERREGTTENKPLLQGSTSLPVLNEDVSARGLQLRETSSWNNRPMPQQRKQVHFNVADAFRQIGDQLNATESAEIESKGGENVVEGRKSVNNDEANKDVYNDVEGNEKNNDNSDKYFETCVNNVCGLSASSSTEEIEEEFKALVNMAADFSCPKPSTSTRKKWKINTDWQIDRKIEISDTPKIDPDDAIDSCQLETEINKAFATSSVIAEDVSPNSSIGFIPKIKDLDKLVVPMKSKSSSLRTEDVESLVKSVSRTLQELIHVFCASRLYFNEKLEQIKQIKVNEYKSQIVEASHTPPRKKRSITTFSASDARPRNEKNPIVSNEENKEKNRNAFKKVENSIDTSKGSKNTTKFEDKRIKDKHIKELSKHNVLIDFIDVVSENFRARKDEPVTKGVVEKDMFKFQVAKKNETSTDAQPFFGKYEHKQREGIKYETNKNESHNQKECLNLESEHPNVPERFSKKKRHANHYNQVLRRSRSPFESRQAQNNRPTRFRNECPPTTRFPQGGNAKIRPMFHNYNNRPPRHTPSAFRGTNIPTRHRPEPSNFLEGGDVMHANHSHRTIGTETDFSQVNDRHKNSNVRVSHSNNGSSHSYSKIRVSNSNNGASDSGSNVKVPSHSDFNTKASHSDTSTKSKLENKSSTPDKGHEAVLRSVNVRAQVTEKSSTRKETTKIISSEKTDIASESFKKEPETPKSSDNVAKPKPDSSLESAPEHSQNKEKKQEKSVVHLSRPVSNSSLNPAAKCFNPSFICVKQDSKNRSLKSSEWQSSTQSESDCHSDISVHSKDSELSGKKFRGYTTDWTVESHEDEAEKYSNSNEQNCHSDRRRNSINGHFSPQTRNKDPRSVAPNSALNIFTNRSTTENGIQGRTNGSSPNEAKGCDSNNNIRHGSSLDLKMAEGDHCNEEPEQEDNPPKQEEPGLGSACGDFIPAEEGNQPQPQVEPQDDVVQNPSEEDRAFIGPIDVQNRGVPGSLPDVGRSAQRLDELELNFACLSGSGESELGSDLSEDYYEELTEPELDT